MIVHQYDLIGWQDILDPSDKIEPIRPQVLNHEQWPPDYKGIHEWRRQVIMRLIDDPDAVEASKVYYSTRPVEFIMDWCDTYDPRRTEGKWIPFVLFQRQEDFILFLHDLRLNQENGLVEKARDMGATWLSCAYTLWSFLFIADDSIGWGSRKEDLVDKIGNPDSIFEKIRLMMRKIPAFFLPKDYNSKKSTSFMKLVNSENGASVAGEAGDNIGRGGRSSMYFKDEAAHYERAELIEAALGDNTNVQIDISSVNGIGNVFHKRREQGQDWTRDHDIPKGYTRVFVMDWSDHPLKTQEWYDTRKAKYEREGMAHIFAQEVDRNYSAAISNTVIPHEWIERSVDAHLKVKYIEEYMQKYKPDDRSAGLDVADGGTDKNSLAVKEWIIWRDVYEWGERDPGVTARKAIGFCRDNRVRVCQYDSIGVGAGVKAEYNRLREDEDVSNVPDFIPWNAGSAVLQPYERIIEGDDDSLTNKEFYENIKSQAWWSLRSRFYKTFKAVTQNVYYPPDELISLDSRMKLLHQLKKELAQATRKKSGRLKDNGRLPVRFTIQKGNELAMNTYGQSSQ